MEKVEENPDEIKLDDSEDEGESGIVSEEKGCPQGCGTEVRHENSNGASNPDEIVLEDEDEEAEAGAGEGEDTKMNETEPTQEKVEETPVVKGRATKFLALGKPGRGKDFLQVSRNLFRTSLPFGQLTEHLRATGL